MEVVLKPYDRLNPFQSRIKERYRLNSAGSTKETWHVVFDLAGSNIRYRPGDSVAIYPENNREYVEELLSVQNWDGEQVITDFRTKESMPLFTFLLKKANLSKPTTKLVHALESDEQMIETHSVSELLKQYAGRITSPDEFVTLLAPLLPRFYSISSSQNSVGDEVHCTIVRVRYKIDEKERAGVCSNFLCDKEKVTTVPIYIQPTKEFMLPEDDLVPIIMVGPGTGIAPFRAFMQERLHRGSSMKKNWLFFGERNMEHDFFYEEYWKELASLGHLRLDTAFSRDQEEKLYVQHKMWEARRELWRWLEEGARLYVCGDASNMAKDVDAILQQIVSTEGGMSPELAKAYVTTLRKEKRYLRDVY